MLRVAIKEMYTPLSSCGCDIAPNRDKQRPATGKHGARASRKYFVVNYIVYKFVREVLRL